MPTLLFDLDGTLIDSAPDIAAALNQVLNGAGLDALSVPEVGMLIGEGVVRLVEKAFAVRGVVLPPERLATEAALMNRLYDDALTVETFVLPHARDALESFYGEGIRTAVVSNKPGHLTRQIIDHYRLTPFLHAVQGAEDHLPKKPAPDMLLNAMKNAKGSALDTVMVGDSGIDVKAARNAGIPVILVRGGYTTIPVDELGADDVIDHLGHLRAALIRRGWSL
ncbi:MAG: HAD family hydrolase [Alphaproteobacteria bacterium]|nr:HAD-IA family hydrolase [Beijerinckiaceae bacterium]NBQ39499.1 HAD family hydrolase [Alphaproteobacteria bacterium]